MTPDVCKSIAKLSSLILTKLQVVCFPIIFLYFSLACADHKHYSTKYILFNSVNPIPTGRGYRYYNHPLLTVSIPVNSVWTIVVCSRCMCCRGCRNEGVLLIVLAVGSWSPSWLPNYVLPMDCAAEGGKELCQGSRDSFLNDHQFHGECKNEEFDAPN